MTLSLAEVFASPSHTIVQNLAALDRPYSPAEALDLHMPQLSEDQLLQQRDLLARVANAESQAAALNARYASPTNLYREFLL